MRHKLLYRSRKFKYVFKYGYSQIFSLKVKNSFTVVTAAYQSESYLDDYFKSIFGNDYPLENLQLVIVDDGSTDNTKDIVYKWKEKYRENIEYVYQENIGQGPARTKGISYAKNNWITFIDSDDFISENYFMEVNNAINVTRGESLISTRYINYFEEDDKYVNDHQLDYRFMGKLSFKMKNLLEDEKFFQLSMNSVFFKRSEILELGLAIRDIKPQFEDAIFVFEYMLLSNNFNIVFISSAEYYYRHRILKNSTLNLAKKDVRRYVDLLNEGYISILNLYENRLGYVPNFLQNAVVYDLSWNIKELEEYRVNLKNEDMVKRELYLKAIFKKISYGNLIHNWKYLWRMYQIGINYKYYGGKEEVKAGAYYFYTSEDYYKIQLISVCDKWSIVINGKSYKLCDFENRKYEEYLNGEYFITKYFLKICKKQQNIEFYYDGRREKIRNFHLRKKKEKQFNELSLLLFFDRDNKADDNAEVFYEWLKENHSEYKRVYFCIRRDCADWERLLEKGFKLIEYGSDEFRNLYIKCDYIISSAGDKKIENYDDLRYQGHISEAKFIFLQHGIITDDLTRWFNTKRMDKIVISTDFEYENIAYKYNFFKSETLLNGLPRYDKLYNSPRKEILFQPTWRYEYEKETDDKFMKSRYMENISRVLVDETLLGRLRQENYVLKFLLHPEFARYKKLFEKFENDCIKVLDITTTIFRDEFAKAKLMITDYSSVFADFSYLAKPVIFYQYDQEEFFKNHLYGVELDYEKEGLGSVQNSHNDLINKILYYFENNFEEEELYKRRREKFFKFTDSKNCQRLYEGLVKRGDGRYEV